MRNNASLQILLALTLFAPCISSGQATVRRNPGRMDADITIPDNTGVLGEQDPGAIAELKAHIAAIGQGLWGGMQGRGTITYGTHDPTGYDATISKLGANKSRLDAQTKKGLESIRVDGRIGMIQGVDSKISLIPSDAASLAIFPFELPRVEGLQGGQASLHDRGLVLIDGVGLHRITYETPTLDLPSKSQANETTSIDLYLDPVTHLLIKTASLVR